MPAYFVSLYLSLALSLSMYRHINIHIMYIHICIIYIHICIYVNIYFYMFIFTYIYVYTYKRFGIEPEQRRAAEGADLVEEHRRGAHVSVRRVDAHRVLLALHSRLGFRVKGLGFRV
jgi:hypothetical protein